MKAITLVGTCFLLALTGCSKSPAGGGGTRASQFTIEGPATTVSIPEGKAHTISLSLSRGGDFKQDVNLHVDAPAGVSVAPLETTVKATEKGDVKLQILIGNNVTPGDHVIHVTGKPESGNPTTLDVNIKVTEASASNLKLNLRGPSAIPTIKQGETRNIMIGLEPNSKYLAHVKLHAAPPTGLKAEFPSDATVKATEGSEVNLKVTAQKNASLGEQTIRVTGIADDATVNPLEVKVKVVAP